MTPAREPDSAPENESTQHIPGAEGTRGPTAETRRGTSPADSSLSEPDLSQSPDQMLGEFRLIRRLGRGGMADVYLAEQTSLHRQVAIKVLRPELMLDETYKQRFQIEARAVAGLNHTNIVQVYTVGEVNGRLFIAQEYVNGQNLRDYLRRKGPPDVPVAISIFRQVASALLAASEAGIVHRDIKPENIMLTRKGEVKVADFGLAKRSSTSESQQLTQIGTTMGTPLYMSPEQINGAKVDHRSDLYSLGITCWHMLAGEPPFRGETAISVAVQHLKEAPPDLAAVRPDLPPQLCKIVHKLIEKKPDNRYQSAKGVISDLKKLTQESRSGGSTRQDSEASLPSFSVDVPATPAMGQSSPYVLHRLGLRLASVADLSWKKQAWRLLAFSVLFLLIGTGVGWLMRPGDPLAAPFPKNPSAATETSVPKFNTADEQYFHASALRTDLAAWEAVAKNFPADVLFTPQALTQLGLLHLSHDRLDEAQQVFQKLVDYGELEPQLQATGAIGKALILSRRGEYQTSQRELLAQEKMWQRLNRQLRQLTRDTLEHNARQLSQPVTERLRKLLEEDPRPQPPAGGPPNGPPGFGPPGEPPPPPPN